MITTNTGAKIIEGSDNWREIFPNGSDPGAHNASVLAHDAGIEGLQDALGIVVDGDQAAVSASSGQYIILKNSTITGCADGLYTATKAIPANTSIDNTYLRVVSGGGLNALNTQLTTLTGNVFNSGTLTDQSSVDGFILTIMNTLGVGQSGGFKITVPGTDTFYCFMSRIATSEGYGYYHRSTLNDAHFVRYNNGIITKSSITTT